MKKISPILMVDELEPTLAFYRDILGFEVKMVMEVEGINVFAQVESGPVEVMLQTRPSMAKDVPELGGAPVASSSVLYIETEDLKSLRARVDGRAEIVVDTREQPYGMREFVVRDPSGYLLALAEPIAEPAVAGPAVEAAVA